MKPAACLVMALLLPACSQTATDSSCAGLRVEDAWIREAPPGMKLTAGYMLLRNTSRQTLTVNRFSSPHFARVELHETVHEDGLARMRPLSGLSIPDTEGLALQPGGWHLMLFNPDAPPRAGDTVSLTLHCGQDALPVVAEVRKGGPTHHQHHGHQQ